MVIPHRRKSFRFAPSGGGSGSTLLTGLWAWYEMAETTNTDNAVDASPNGRTWTRLINMTPDATSAPDGGACRVATSNGVSMSRAHENATNSSDITIAGWFYLAAAPGTALNVHFDNGTPNFYNLGFINRGVSSSRIYINNTLTTVTHSTTLTTSAWHCYTLVYNLGSSVATLWIDGVLQSTTASGTPATVSSGNMRSQTGATGNKYTSIALWTKALSNAEVAEFYNGGINLRYANL
jgi:hypothetical protein